MDCYEFLKEDLYAEGKINQALGPLFALNKEKAAQAFYASRFAQEHAQTDNATNKVSGGSKCNPYWMEGGQTYGLGKRYLHGKN